MLAEQSMDFRYYETDVTFSVSEKIGTGKSPETGIRKFDTEIDLCRKNLGI